MRRLLSGRIQRQILRSLKYDSTKADLSFRHGLPVITVTLPSRKGSRQKIDFAIFTKNFAKNRRRNWFDLENSNFEKKSKFAPFLEKKSMTTPFKKNQ